MDELAKQGQWWLLLLVPIATGLFALFGSWLGSALSRRSEQKQWTRNKKQEAYADFIGHMRLFQQESYPAIFDMVGEPLPVHIDGEAEEERLRAYWQLELVSNDSVAEGARGLLDDLSIYHRTLKNSGGLLKTYLARVGHPLPFDNEEKRAELEDHFKTLSKDRQAEILQEGFEAVRKRTQWLVQLMRDDLGMRTKERFPPCDGAELRKLAAEHDMYRNALLIEDQE